MGAKMEVDMGQTELVINQMYFSPLVTCFLQHDFTEHELMHQPNSRAVRDPTVHHFWMPVQLHQHPRASQN